MKIPDLVSETNFSGADKLAYGKCKVVFIPVPFDGTASYKKGTARAPRAIIDASMYLEWFDEELVFEPASLGFCTLKMLPSRGRKPEEIANSVEKIVSQVIEDGKFPFILGGEHSISAGAFAALKQKIGGFTVLQFDAHTDLRDEYEGSKYSHACVMRRALDLGLGIVQVGVRSLPVENHEWMQKNMAGVKTFYAKDKAEWKISEIIAACGKKVYVSFDVDAFDSSIMPATGTPEPGGIAWADAMAILREVGSKREIIGADVMELLPTPGLHACDFLAAKLAYKIIGYSFARLRR
ncbi:MAG: agmatinase [Candidatus Micrarchaeota archaeon]